MEVTLIKDISPEQRSWRNDPETMRHTRQSEYLSEADQERWLKKIEEDPSIQMFGILTKTSTVPAMNVGTCGLTSISLLHGTAEYSLLIGKKYRGKGYGRAALEALLKYAFNNLGLYLVWGEIFETNPAGTAIARRLGFKEDALLKKRYFKEGKRIDTIIVSKTRA